MSHQYYVGLMSGTSMDGVDAVLVDFQSGQPCVVATYEEAIPEFLLEKLHLLANPTTEDIILLGECDRACGELFGNAVNNLLKQTNISAEEVIAIGSHGQTIRHMPNLTYPFSLQIGDACTIAVNTGIDTVADFRRKDIALRWARRAFGSCLSSGCFFKYSAHDRDYFKYWWNSQYYVDLGSDGHRYFRLMILALAIPYSIYGIADTIQTVTMNEGQWAATGEVSQPLLNKMLQHSYFHQSAPKSTGRELFNISWLNQYIKDFSHLSPQDIQATLTQLTAQSIAKDIKKQSSSIDIFICGGGVFNKDLISRLQQLLPKAKISSTIQLGVAPQWVEGVAFAWLAYCFVNNKTSNLPEVTGAKKAAILGAFYPAN